MEQSIIAIILSSLAIFINLIVFINTYIDYKILKKIKNERSEKINGCKS